MNKPYLLFKIHSLEACTHLQNVTRYLYAICHDLRPQLIIERNFPKDIKIFPTLLINENAELAAKAQLHFQRLEGLDAIIEYYEKQLGINNLLEKTKEFDTLNPSYKITDKSTHKNVIFPKN